MHDAAPRDNTHLPRDMHTYPTTTPSTTSPVFEYNHNEEKAKEKTKKEEERISSFSFNFSISFAFDNS